MNAKLQNLQSEKNSAAVRLDEEMARLWPEGSTVRVKLQHRQTRASTGTVIGHHDGRLTVQLSTVNRRGNQTVKRVHWKQVLS